MFLRDGQPIFDTGFHHQEVTYPPGWMALATAEELVALGISEVPEPPSSLHVWDGEAWSLNAENLAWYLNDRRTSMLADINRTAATDLAVLSAAYPDGEVQSWSQQVREAEALAANVGAHAPLLSAIAVARGVPVADLAARVLAKTQAYAIASGAIIGRRQALEDALMAVDLKAADVAEQLVAITGS